MADSHNFMADYREACFQLNHWPLSMMASRPGTQQQKTRAVQHTQYANTHRGQRPRAVQPQPAAPTRFPANQPLVYTGNAVKNHATPTNAAAAEGRAGNGGNPRSSGTVRQLQWWRGAALEWGCELPGRGASRDDTSQPTAAARSAGLGKLALPLPPPCGAPRGALAQGRLHVVPVCSTRGTHRSQGARGGAQEQGLWPSPSSL